MPLWESSANYYIFFTASTWWIYFDGDGDFVAKSVGAGKCPNSISTEWSYFDTSDLHGLVGGNLVTVSENPTGKLSPSCP